MFENIKKELDDIKNQPAGRKSSSTSSATVDRRDAPIDDDSPFPEIARKKLSDATIRDLRRTVTRGVVFGLFFWSLWVALAWLVFWLFVISALPRF